MCWQKQIEGEAGSDETMLPKEEDNDPDKPRQPTSPPESTFKKLGPSRSRYTLLKDEL